MFQLCCILTVQAVLSWVLQKSIKAYCDNRMLLYCSLFTINYHCVQVTIIVQLTSTTYNPATGKQITSTPCNYGLCNYGHAYNMLHLHASRVTSLKFCTLFYVKTHAGVPYTPLPIDIIYVYAYSLA